MKKGFLFSVIVLLGFAAFGQNAPKPDPPTDQVPNICAPVILETCHALGSLCTSLGFERMYFAQ
jgi:hypothetical protein